MGILKILHHDTQKTVFVVDAVLLFLSLLSFSPSLFSFSPFTSFFLTHFPLSFFRLSFLSASASASPCYAE
jgi:hypothetical protein